MRPLAFGFPVRERELQGQSAFGPGWRGFLLVLGLQADRPAATVRTDLLPAKPGLALPRVRLPLAVEDLLGAGPRRQIQPGLPFLLASLGIGPRLPHAGNP